MLTMDANNCLTLFIYENMYKHGSNFPELHMVDRVRYDSTLSYIIYQRLADLRHPK